jgi:hypothetical protein
MTRILLHRRAMRAALLATFLGAGAVACEPSKHASDGDTGAAAPATVPDLSATPGVPDSTTGISNPTGAPSTPGDTLGARGRDSSKGSSAGRPAGP